MPFSPAVFFTWESPQYHQVRTQFPSSTPLLQRDPRLEKTINICFEFLVKGWDFFPINYFTPISNGTVDRGRRAQTGSVICLRSQRQGTWHFLMHQVSVCLVRNKEGFDKTLFCQNKSV
eukprot:sb/3476345/